MLVFDLDGTILSINSFRPWARHIVTARFRHLPPWRRAVVAAQACTALASRKSGLINHHQFQWKLQHLWQAAVQGDGGLTEIDFADSLLAYVRPELATVLAAVSDGKQEAVLA